MGMFDTFHGKIRCPQCGELHDFEEQTKSYNCVMEDFKIGDYIDKANENYIYPFDAYCYKYKTSFTGSIIVVRGQIIKFVNTFELEQIKDINVLKNIEEGLGWRLDYEERCKQGVGYNNDTKAFGYVRYEYEQSNWQEHPKRAGDRLFALNNDWLITEVYKEILTNDKSNNCNYLYEGWYRDNYVYKVTDKLGDRMARVTETYIELYYDNGLKNNWDNENPHDYFIQYGCELINIGGTK